MTYKTKCNGNCVDRIDRQADTIRKLRDESLKKTEALNQASQVIENLEDELKLYRQQYNFRPDQNWDGGFRAEGVIEE